LHNKKNLKSELLKGGLGSIVIKVSNTLLGFLTTLVLARLLGASNYGAYSFALTIILFLTLPVQMGLPQLITREIAKMQALQHWGLMREIWQWSKHFII
jgi:O-antigen/teichoic acid export membrane protein